jgi:hypothetical protein
MVVGMDAWTGEREDCSQDPLSLGILQDINGDGRIGIIEAIYILQRIAGLR